jgi:hypothetical protein
MTAEIRLERIEVLNALIERAAYIDHGPPWRATISGYRNEIQQLRAA